MVNQDIIHYFGSSLSFLLIIIRSGRLVEIKLIPLDVKYYYYYLLFSSFFTSALADCLPLVFEWQQSPQVSRALLSILAVLNNVVVWMVSTSPPTSKSSSYFDNTLVTVTKVPIAIDIIVTFMFHNFFNSLARSRYLSFFSHSFSFILWSAGTTESKILQILFFFCCWLLLGLVFWLRLGDLSVYESPIGVYVCHFLGQMLVCAYTICSYSQI